jgi:hypothetical protein
MENRLVVDKVKKCLQKEIEMCFKGACGWYSPIAGICSWVCLCGIMTGLGPRNVLMMSRKEVGGGRAENYSIVK